MSPLEKYYNKFNEEHRLTTRHGIVEYTTAMKYIHDFIPSGTKVKIADIGAGTGRYSVALSQEGHSVTAVELVPRNLQVLRSKHANVNCWSGNALDLHFLPDETFDITLLFGPLYHLHTQEERLQAFAEAKRITKTGGYIFAAYVMNEYSILTYCFKQNHIKECMQNNALTENFHTKTDKNELYSYLRTEDIAELNQKSGLTRIKLIAADGAADYMRQSLNALDEESFSYFISYHLSICERQ
nr:methyltransferase domain-containing protein [Treponema sp.]